MRFKIRLSTIITINIYTPNRYIVIERKFAQICKNLKERLIIIDFCTVDTKGPTITLSNTITLLVKELTSIEHEIKGILLPLRCSFNISPDIKIHKRLTLENIISNLFPLGLTGVYPE